MKYYEVPDRPNYDHPDVCGEDREPDDIDDSVRSSASVEGSENEQTGNTMKFWEACAKLEIPLNKFHST